MNENYLVTKANTLITSNYDLSLEEQRIILTLASTVQPEDEDFKPYKFKISDFMYSNISFCFAVIVPSAISILQSV